MPRAERGQVVKVDKASGHSRFRIRQGERASKESPRKVSLGEVGRGRPEGLLPRGLPG